MSRLLPPNSVGSQLPAVKAVWLPDAPAACRPGRTCKAQQLLPATEPQRLARAEARGNSHVRFLGGPGAAMRPAYPAIPRVCQPGCWLLRAAALVTGYFGGRPAT